MLAEAWDEVQRRGHDLIGRWSGKLRAFAGASRSYRRPRACRVRFTRDVESRIGTDIVGGSIANRTATSGITRPDAMIPESPEDLQIRK
jgi:hypothetical protein